MISSKDDAYLKLLIKSGAYGAIVHALVANGAKYNMLNSAIIELFEFIRKVKSAVLFVLLARNVIN